MNLLTSISRSCAPAQVGLGADPNQSTTTTTIDGSSTGMLVVGGVVMVAIVGGLGWLIYKKVQLTQTIAAKEGAKGVLELEGGEALLGIGTAAATRIMRNPAPEHPTIELEKDLYLETFVDGTPYRIWDLDSSISRDWNKLDKKLGSMYPGATHDPYWQLSDDGRSEFTFVRFSGAKRRA